jgi:hypothetical protein
MTAEDEEKSNKLAKWIKDYVSVMIIKVSH